MNKEHYSPVKLHSSSFPFVFLLVIGLSVILALGLLGYNAMQLKSAPVETKGVEVKAHNDGL